MPWDSLLTIVGLAISVWGVVAAVRYQLIRGSALILGGLLLGLLGSTYLD
ncbi:hypothetical protein FB561_2866 [Kribbella amoyensis]|uniref:Uncharacterized protein n=1 Tax=Kribbella amoyensis TaxID=996641 RepID=A0A561BS78_9ACTN|nr:hypothetical protein [Kribbella amoyensis]TWD81744.1 hypothetical protein FB561_2866 [Kribbella amoyensis]